MANFINSTKVTVGIALYNHQDYIEQCLNSIVNQTHKNIELIVIDDGSPDNSYQRAKTFLEQQKVITNYQIITRTNKGMCNTLNEIAQMASGDYISFVGSDDYWAENKIADQATYLDRHPEIALVHSNSIKVDNKSQPIKTINYANKQNSGNLYEALIYRKGGINTPSHLYRTTVYQKIGYYDPELKFEDTDFWLRLTKQFQVGFINEIHSYYRWHGGNMSDKKKVYKKSIETALKTGELKYFFFYLKKYFSV